MCEEKGAKVPEAKLGRCIRSKEKELLDKCDGLATAAGNETRPKYSIQYIHDITGMHQNTPRCRVPDIFKRRSQFGLELSSADRRTSKSRCCVMQESSR